MKWLATAWVRGCQERGSDTITLANSEEGFPDSKRDIVSVPARSSGIKEVERADQMTVGRAQGKVFSPRQVASWVGGLVGREG